MIEYIITFGVIGLILFYFLLKLFSSRQLKKLQGRYKPEDDTSRRENQSGTNATELVRTLQREPSTQRVIEPEAGRVLEDASLNTVSDPESELGDIKSKPKRKWFSRKKSEVKEESKTL